LIMSVNILEIAINNAKKETIKSTTKDKNLNYSELQLVISR